MPEVVIVGRANLGSPAGAGEFETVRPKKYEKRRVTVKIQHFICLLALWLVLVPQVIHAVNQEYFKKGMLRLTATDQDGWARLGTSVYKWNEEKRRWDRVIKEQYTSDG